MKRRLFVHVGVAAAAGFAGAQLGHISPIAQAVDVAIAPAHAQSVSVAIASYRAAVARAAASVVTVHSARTQRVGPRGLLGRDLLVQGLGSGVILDREGYVVTNDHVVHDATDLAVALADGSLHAARVIGTDPDSDLALLKIDAGAQQPIAIGDVSALAVGDVVLAVGNPLGVGQTVTQGILSAMGRKGIGMQPVENYLQTDAAINQGNSGGALIDTAGRLVGINSAMLSRSGGYEGIGFAIPVDLVQKVVASLRKNGRVPRGWLGIATMQPPRGEGALVTTVDRDGPAHRAGVAPGDTIVRFGDRDIRKPEDLTGLVLEVEPGTRVRMEVLREGRRSGVDVTLAARSARRAEK